MEFPLIQYFDYNQVALGGNLKKFLAYIINSDIILHISFSFTLLIHMPDKTFLALEIGPIK